MGVDFLMGCLDAFRRNVQSQAVLLSKMPDDVGSSVEPATIRTTLALLWVFRKKLLSRNVTILTSGADYSIDEIRKTLTRMDRENDTI